MEIKSTKDISDVIMQTEYETQNKKPKVRFKGVVARVLVGAVVFTTNVI